MLALLVLVGLATAQVSETEVNEAAAAVAQARGSGARRSEIQRLMRIYRSLAEQLPRTPPTDLGVERRELLEALATGKKGKSVRDRMVARIGTPAERLPRLELAMSQAAVLKGELRGSLLTDIAEQAALLGLISQWDAVRVDLERRRLEVRSASAGRVVPGQTAAISAAVVARKAAARAQLLLQERGVHERLHARASALQTSALALLENR